MTIDKIGGAANIQQKSNVRQIKALSVACQRAVARLHLSAA